MVSKSTRLIRIGEAGTSWDFCTLPVPLCTWLVMPNKRFSYPTAWKHICTPQFLYGKHESVIRKFLWIIYHVTTLHSLHANVYRTHSFRLRRTEWCIIRMRIRAPLLPFLSVTWLPESVTDIVLVPWIRMGMWGPFKGSSTLHVQDHGNATHVSVLFSSCLACTDVYMDWRKWG